MKGKHYVAPSNLFPNKWAVFTPDGAQLQATQKNTKEEAQALADGLNNKKKE